MHSGVKQMINQHALASHVLVALAHARGHLITVRDLAEALGVRREDVRAMVTQLHLEGHVDALSLRLTLSGLAIAASLDGCKLPSLRERPATRVLAVA
jgi:DNA-binding MarR family transcriptional regulator